MPEETVGVTDTIGCDCEPCKRKGGLAHNVTDGLIHEYTSTPRNGWRPRYTAAEAAEGRTPPTFGIELETDAPSFRVTDLPDRPYVGYLPMDASAADRLEHERLVRARDEWDARNRRHRARQRERFEAQGSITAAEAVSLSAPRGLWHAKHDGSVSGPEFASQPGTLAYWRSQRGHLAGMFKALLHGGMRSHDGDRCGFHVNIGADAFGPSGPYGDDRQAAADHLYRFLTLVCMNPRWSTRMSQRTHQSVGWARFEPLSTPSARRATADGWARNGSTYCEHSTVVNTSHVGRVEFRLPRGTLRLDRFYVKLEWTAAMVEYTRDAANPVRPSDFMRWCKASGEYPTLVAYMSERFNAARFGETDEVAA